MGFRGIIKVREKQNPDFPPEAKSRKNWILPDSSDNVEGRCLTTSV